MNKLEQQECLELAKKCGGASLFQHHTHVVMDAKALSAYTSAIEEKYQAQIAMLRSIANEVLDNNQPSTSSTPLNGRDRDALLKGILATQATSDAFIAEVKAGAESAAVKDAMELLLKHGADHDWRIMAKNMGNSWAELRNHAQAEGSGK